MTEGLSAAIAGFGIAAAIGAGFTLGVIGVCRWLQWAPVNITVNNYADTITPGAGSENEPAEITIRRQRD
jgi:hypothetical protein